MASNETPQQSGQPHLQKQDLATLVSDHFSELIKVLIWQLAWLYFLLKKVTFKAFCCSLSSDLLLLECLKYT